MSKSNVTQTLTAEEWNKILHQGRIPLICGMFLLFCVGSIGNILVISVYKLRMKDQEGRFYIPYLAIADLIATTVTSTFLLLLDFTEALFPSDPLCRFLQFLNWSGVQNSILMLFLIAVHRYLLICRPHNKRLQPSRKRILVACAAATSVIVSIPLLVFSGAVELHVNYKGSNVSGLFCSFNHGDYPTGEKVYQGILFGSNIVLLFATTILYIPIGRVVFDKSRKSEQAVNSSSASVNNTNNVSDAETTDAEISTVAHCNIAACSDESEEKASNSHQSCKNAPGLKESTTANKRTENILNARKKFTITLMMVVFLYVISYVPFYVIIYNGINDLDVWFNLPPATLNGYLFINRCYILNNVMNPIIYSMFDRVFRNELVGMVRTCVGRFT